METAKIGVAELWPLMAKMRHNEYIGLLQIKEDHPMWYFVYKIDDIAFGRTEPIYLIGEFSGHDDLPRAVDSLFTFQAALYARRLMDLHNEHVLIDTGDLERLTSYSEWRK